MDDLEFDEMYADELEMVRRQIEDDEDADALQKYADECSSSITRPTYKSKRSLNFIVSEPNSEHDLDAADSIESQHTHTDNIASQTCDDSQEIQKNLESECGNKKRTRSDQQLEINDVLPKTDDEDRTNKKLKLSVESADVLSNETKNSKKIHQRIPEGDFISIRGHDGSVSYVSVLSDNVLKQCVPSSSSSHHTNLLSIPVSVMKVVLHEQKHNKGKEKLVMRNESETSLVMDHDSHLHGNLIDRDGESEEQNVNVMHSEQSDTGHPDVPETHLWVDKYAPQRYSDLISEESTNRSLLRWLKLWDYACFGKELVQNSNKNTFNNNNNIKKNTFNNYNNNNINNNNENKNNTDTNIGGSAFRNNNNNNFRRNNNMNNNNYNNNNNNFKSIFEELDKNKRPIQKVALVSGPPGLGKTTLAHVIARHAGYNVVEMNASDDRSADVFREKIESSTQMRSVLGDVNPKPNCLIIDEIDGAPQPAIDVLLNIIKKSDPNTTTTTSTSTTSTKTRKKHEFVLLRPIICICNDLYVPALRMLRQHCCLVTFHPSITSTLAERLLEICRAEGMHTDLTTLMALCEKADNDVRSCINTLQFSKTKHGSELNLRTVTSLNLGQKDVHRSLLSVWQAIFTLPKPTRKRYVNPHDRLNFMQQLNQPDDEDNSSNSSDRFKNLLHLISSTGEDAKLQQGLFDNYLISNAKDPRMDMLVEAVDWLCHADLLDTYQSERQDYSVMRYAPFLSIAMHFLFAVNRPHKILFPKSQFEFHTNQSRRMELLSSVIQHIHPSVRPYINNNMVIDLLPYVSEVIKPTLRPVNVQLFSSQEKESLALVVQVMMSYNLSYKQDRGVDGQYVYNVEPNVDEIIHFQSLKTGKQMSYGCKQLIAREIELEKMRRMEKMKPTNVSNPPAIKPAAKSLNHFNQKLQPKPIKPLKEVKVHVDFFGRKIEKPVQGTDVKQTTEDGAPTTTTNQTPTNKASIFGQVWYKYKEGFTNAVRRSVKIADFL